MSCSADSLLQTREVFEQTCQFLDALLLFDSFAQRPHQLHVSIQDGADNLAIVTGESTVAPNSPGCP